MQVTYLGPSADLELPGGVVERGKSIDVSDELGAELVERGDFVAGSKPPSVKELRAEAEALGIEVPPKAKAAQIVALIAAGPPAPDESDPDPEDVTGDES